MIKVVGTVEFLTPKSSSHYNIRKRKARIQPVETEQLTTRDGALSYKISAKFEILLEKDYNCKSENDYVGKVKPFLDSLIVSSLILNTQIYSIGQVYFPLQQ
ncbi:MULTISPECIES: hypothetical protein [Sporosarcina]|uniref:Uncharacterized protein n=1 Tax=Sporosarcina contaminans TaxID=633403 RepID=A0ABW3U2L1_9BACL